MFSIVIDRDGRRFLNEDRALSDARPVLVWLGLAAGLALAATSLGANNEVQAARRVTQAPAAYAPAAPTLKIAARDELARDVSGRGTRA